MSYLINHDLVRLGPDHHSRMIDKNEISNHNSSCPNDVGEVANSAIDHVEHVTIDVEDKVVERKPFNTEWELKYFLSFQLS